MFGRTPWLLPGWLALLVMVGASARADQSVSEIAAYNGHVAHVSTGASHTNGDPCVIASVSTASLSGLPAGPPAAGQIKVAYLYWSATGATDVDVTLDGAPVTAVATYQHVEPGKTPFFLGRANVTAQVQAKGNGVYAFSDLTVDNGPTHCTAGSIDVVSAWALVVVYEDPALPYANVKVWDGFQPLLNTSATYTLTGLNVPAVPSGRLTSLLFEGDVASTGNNERILFNGGSLTNALNPSQNIYNSTISNLAVGSSNTYTVDLDTFDVSPRLSSGQTSATVQIGTATDFVLLGGFALTATALPPADLSITKSDGLASYLPGGALTYTITASNAGPEDVTGAIVKDTFSNLIGTRSWTCVASTGATCSGGTAGNISDTVTIPAGGSATYTISATVVSNATGNLVNTATITAPATVTDPVTANNTATDTDTRGAAANLGITKTDGVTLYIPGGSLTYTIVVSNAGPDTVTGATVTDILPAELTGATWTCVGTNGATCAASGSGNIADTVTMQNGKSLTYTVSALVAPSATGSLANTATVALPPAVTDLSPGNNTATDTDSQVATIRGQVFEDRNYGGGAGRSPGASSGVGRPGVRVERYTSSGAFVDAQTTDAAGVYGFPVTTSGSYIVRVVNGSVRSSRTGANGTELAVQTYRTDASSGTAVPVTDKVGGEEPQSIDAPANTGTQTLANLQNQNGMYTQSIASVATTLAGVAGVDFGFNFDTIVSTRDAGQGSLRQFIKNANLLTDDASLNPGGRTPGRETSVFMIPTTDPGYQASPLAYTISPLSALDTVTNPVILDATTQPGWASAPIVQLLGANAGAASNGLTITAGNSTVRGFVIGRFGSDAVELTSGGSNKVAGNYLGTNVAGTGASANTRDGIYVTGSKNNVLGGTTAADRNVISGNTWVGIQIDGAGTTGNVIQGNYIGVDVTGNVALPNRNDGVDVSGGAGQTTIGGTAAGAGNVISGNNRNTMDGIWINLGSGNTIQGNKIGTNAAGTAAIPNAHGGIVLLDSNNNTVGGTTGAEANLIAFNNTGVIVDGTSQGNAIRLNSIFSNTALGIDLDGNGLTRNDLDDADIGPNDLRNFPVIQYAGIVGTNLVLAGWARKDSAIDFFVAVLDTNGFGEGKTAITTLTENTAADNDSSTGTYANPVNGLNQGTDTTNRFSFTIPLPATVASGTKLTSTATISGDTSEFGGNVTATLMPDLGITKTDGLTFYNPGQTLTYTIVVTNTGSSGVVGANVSDVFPVAISSASWTCVATGGASCAPSGTGNINDTVTIPVNGTLTYTVTATVAAAATGNLVNTAVVTPPAGVIDPIPANNTATDTDPPPTANLGVTKTDGVATYTPGLALTYTIVVINAGPSQAIGATVTDAFPAALTNATWTCVAAPGSSCTASGSGNINDTVTLPAGGTVTYTATATVASSATGNLKNTASVSAPPGVIDPVSGNNSASDQDSKGTSVTDLAITKSDGVATYSPGGTVTYTIAATNSGPSDAIDARLSDLVMSLPQVAAASWTCVATGGASCNAGPRAGNINAERVDLPVGGTVTFILVTTLASSASGDLVNSASIAPPSGGTDPTPANNAASDTDTRGALASDLAITKTDGVLSYSAGGNLTYTIKVTNLGPSDAAGANVQDTFPAGITSASWTCAPTAGASCTASGSGNINDGVNVPVGGSVTYTVTANLISSLTGTLTNTATVSAPASISDPSLSNNSASDTDTLGTSNADLRITKTDGVASYLPGGTLTYTIVVSNSGPADVTGATVTDTFPAAFVSATWNCVASAGASCSASGSGNINDSVNIPLGNSVTYTVTALVASSQTGRIKNTASVSPPAGVGDPVSGNSSASDEDNPGAAASDLAITKSDGVATYSPGGTVTYTIVATNLGPSDAIDARVSDLVTSRPQVAGATWTCVGTGGATCRSGPVSGNINAEHVDLPVGSTVTFTLVATLQSSATGDLVNTASVAPASGATDPVATNNAASDTDTRGASSSDLAITKTDGVLSYSAGGTITYTIKVTNLGPSDATGAKVQDTFPGELTSASWTCEPTAGASCTASGSGNIDDSVNVPVGRSITYTVTATVLSSLTGPLTNTATVSAPNGTTDPVLANNSASDTDTLGTSNANLGITKSDGVASYLPGGTLTYTIVVGNSGPADVTGATVTDTFPAAIASGTWSCVAAAGASCTASGSGDINDSVNVPLGSSVTYTVTAIVASSQTGNFKNTARVSPPAGVGDPVSGNNSATDEDSQGSSVADLVITKSDGVATYSPGGTVTYTIAATNFGPTAANDARLSDLVTSLPQVAGASWTCVGTGGATCPAGPKNGSINSERVDLPVGGTVTVTLVVTLRSSATGDLVNTASIVPPSGMNDPTPANNTAADTDTRGALSSNLGITKTDDVLSYSAGGTLTYTIKVTNSGSSDATGATVRDTFPAGITGASWTCSATAGGSCTAGGSGDIDDSVNVPVGAILTYTVDVTLMSSLTGDLTNTATVSAPAGTTDPALANNSASDTDTLSTSKADLRITKTDGVASYLPGGTLTYTIVVSNSGPADVAGATVTDTFPAAIASATWNCVAAAGASCTASGSGNINDSVSIVLGSSVTYTVTAVVASSQTGNFKNTARVSPPAGVGDPVSGNNTANDEDSQGGAVAELVITKSDGIAVYLPGGTLTYTITATNLGPSDAIDARLSDLVMSLPQVASASWTCVATGGAVCNPGPKAGGINAESVDLPVGGTVTFTLVVTLKSSAAGTLVNTATVTPHAPTTDPNGANNSAQDTDLRGPLACDVRITKSDGVGSYAPGGTLTYTIVASNLGPSDAPGALVSDPVASLPQLTGASWTCIGTGGATCTPGPQSGSITSVPVDLPVGGAATFTLVATLAPTATGDLTNTATIAAPVGAVDAIPGNNSAADTDTQAATAADLAITKSDGVATYTPGGTLTYTIVVSNAGPVDVSGATVVDTFTASIASASWSCAHSAGASCTATGSGNINDSVNIPAGQSLTYTVTAAVASAASGTLVNTASVSPPAGIGDPVSSNNSASDQDGAEAAVADLAVTKSDGVATYSPGGTVTYTITATNLGPSDAIDARVSDLVASLPQVASASWTCLASAGATCSPGPQSGDISSERVDLPVGGAATFTLVVTLESSATGDLVNVATIVPPAGTTDPASANATASDTDTLGALSSDLAITKSDGVSSYSPGGTLTYTIEVTNLGPSDAAGAKVQDTFPAGVSSASWTCAASAGASCAAAGTGTIDDTVNVPVGEILTYTVLATLAPALTGDLVNTATVSAPTGSTDPTLSNNASSDTDTQGAAAADLGITKSDGVAAYTPGGTLTYTLVVSNAGPADIVGASVSDAFPAGIASASWSCTPSSGASCTSTGSGDINDIVGLPAGQSVTYTVTALVAASATGPLTNTANVSPPTGFGDPVSSNNSASDQDSEGSSVADLVVTKSDGVPSYTPGGTLTYAITATNLGPSDAVGARVQDTFPAGITGASWTCVPSAGASCSPTGSGNIDDSVNVPVGATLAYTVVATLSPSLTGNLVNTATVSAPTGTTDPTLANNAASDTDAQGTTAADLGITKTDGVATYTPDGTLTYTIVVSNAGPADVAGATVTDTFPAAIASATWTCAAAAGAACAATGSGNINDTVSLPAGKSVTYTVTAVVASSASGDLVNTATVSAPTGTPDPAPANDSASDTDKQGASAADLGITKTDGVATYTPGGTLTYTIVVSNAGPANVAGATVSDTFPAGIASATWTCVASAGASCTASGSGNINDTVSLAAGTSVTYAVAAVVTSSATGNLVNVAGVVPPSGTTDPTPANDTASDTDAPGAPSSDLAIVKDDGVLSYSPGGTLTYTIKVSNLGPSDVAGAKVSDTLPAELTSASWTCAPSTGASCTTSGSGDIGDNVDVPAGATLTYTLTATVLSSMTGNLTNTATVSVPTGTTDPVSANDSSSDTDTQGTSSADLGITKSDGAASYTPGRTLTYTIVVSNAGPADVAGATVTDTFPTAIASATWSCVAGAGASCAASGNGSINDTVGLPAGTSVTYTVTAVVASSATGNLVNTAGVSPPAGVGDAVSGNNSATDQDSEGSPAADLVITKSDGVTSYSPGGTVTYTITATNLGPSDAIDARLSDLVTSLPQVAAASWTCVASGGAACAAGPQSGDISSERVDLPVGGTATFTLVVTLASSASGDLVNTASIVPPSGASDPVSTNDTAVDTDTRGALVSDLAIVKDDGVPSYSPGGTLTYTVKVTNLGPADTVGATVSDTFPAGIVGAAWTCAPSAGASCAASGSGSIADTVNVPAGAIVTYTVTATLAPSLTGDLTNTATVSVPTATTDPTLANNSASDTDTQGASAADLGITKSDGVATYTPGGALTYTIVVSNAGPADVAGGTVIDTFPASIASAAWSCAPSAGASCTATGSGSISDSVGLPAGTSVTYTVVAPVASSASGNLANTASVSPPSGVGDPVSSNNSATDQDAAGTSIADLAVTKTDGVLSYGPGGTLNYTITVTNLGPSDAVGATVHDTLPAQIASASWSCAAPAGASCAATGSGSINDTVTIPAGASVTYALIAQVSSGATGTLVNTATVTSPTSASDPVATNNTATDTDAQGASVADLRVTKTDGVASYTPGGMVIYTIVVGNLGPADVAAATVSDLLPASIASAPWTCVASAGASCAASGSGTINDSVSIPAGGTVTYTVVASIDSTASGTLVNTATVAAPAAATDPNPANNLATDTDTQGTRIADLAVTKTDGVTSYTPGATTTYTIVVSNAGPSAVHGAVVGDTFPAGIASASWTCVAQPGATCTASGNGNLADVVNLPVGKDVTYTVVASIAGSATGALINTATVAAPTGDTDPQPGNNSASDSDTEGGKVADLGVTKTDGVTEYTPGTTTTYTIVVSNAGPSNAVGATVNDTFPPAITGASWTCVASAGAACLASGTGSINGGVILPAGGSVTYTVTASIAASATGNLANTVTVAPPAGVTDPVATNDSATDTDARATIVDLRITNTDGAPSYTPGTTTTYTLVVTNVGPSDAVGATVSDAFPAAVTSASWACAASAGASCAASGAGNINQAVDIPVGGSVTYSVVATTASSASGDLVNTAAVALPPNATDPAPADNTASDTDTMSASADLSLTKSVDNASPRVGSTVVYTVIVANAGPSDATGVDVADPLPSGVAWVSDDASSTGTTYDAATGAWTVGTLPAGTSKSLHISTRVLPAGSWVNDAQVSTSAVADPDSSPGNGSGNGEDDQASVAIVPTAAIDLSLAKTVDVPAPAVGSNVVFTLTVANAAGLSDATGVVVADLLPAGFTHVSDDATSSATSYDAASGDWSVGGLASGSSKVLHITARVRPTGPWMNVAQVAAAFEADVDSTPGNGTGSGEDDASSAAATPPGNDGTVDVTDIVIPGQPVTVTVHDVDLDLDTAVAESTSIALVDLATGESETLTLNETGPATAVFTATAATVFGTAAGANNDGVLVVQAGQQLAASYFDERTAASGSLTRTDAGLVAGGVDGSIAMPATVSAGGSLNVTVTDRDLDANPAAAESVTVTIANDTTGESETVVLAETGSTTGIFTGSVGTALGNVAGPAGDGVIVALPGEMLTARYLDAFTAAGGTAVRLAAARAVADVIRLDKRATKDEVILGELVGFVVTATNTAPVAMPGVLLEDSLPPGFKLVENSARLSRAGTDGLLGTQDDTTTVLATTGGRPIVLGPVDFAANEAVAVTYLLRSGAGAVPGARTNRVMPIQLGLPVGNSAEASVTLVADPVLDGCRILGKVFQDTNRNGVQDEGEPGVAQATVVLDEGTYAVTDAFGRYHLPAVTPGQRLVKLDVGSLSAGSETVGDDSRILWLTPGLTGHADFPVITVLRETSIGSPGESGLRIEGAAEHDPVAIQGKAEQLSVLVNDRLVDLAWSAVQIQTTTLDDIVVLAGNQLKQPVRFQLSSETTREAKTWRLAVDDATGATIKTVTGDGPPSALVTWDGTSDAGEMVRAGEIYQYQLEVVYRDGSVAKSAKRLLGVNRDKVVSVELRGEAFASNQTVLSGKAQETLRKVVELLRTYPDEKILIEGHTDGAGSAEYNLELSRKRAEAARDYLGKLGFPVGRTVIHGYGKERPIAPNDSEAGRELNRRVEVKSQVVEVQSTEITERYRTEPSVTVNGESVPLGPMGRFATELDSASVPRVDLKVADSQGRLATAQVELPRLELDVPETEVVSRTSAPKEGAVCRLADSAMECLVRGRTDPGNSVWVGSRAVEVGADGSFAIAETLATGENAIGILARNPKGYSHTANLVLKVSDRDAEGNVVVATKAVPRLTLTLPPDGTRIDSGVLAISGRTDPGNHVVANETELTVGHDGAVSGSLTLPAGKSTVTVRVTDPQGNVGEIVSTYEVPQTRLFLLAFADGEFGQLNGKGYIEGAGLGSESSTYTDGRVAVYLKGRISGKYLITAAFDSGREDGNGLFGDLDQNGQQKLLTNLDPNLYYTVYGDDSTTVYDVETQGHFYLAVDGETIHAVVGNYPIAFRGTELATYQRTLYGARFLYRSAQTNSRSEPKTEVVVFGAEVRQGHIRDELRATGGSLYYLSHKDIVEGGEQVSLVVRDKNTGLELSRVAQRQNFDYTIRYPEGRIVFNRPVWSVQDGGTLADGQILQGNPVSIQVDYEAALQDFEKTAAGARVVQQLGDHVAIGGTYVRDELQGGPYELMGVDAQAHLADGTLLAAELADSSGTDALTFVSNDGGLSFATSAPTGTEKGSAARASAEFDVGRWFKTPDRYKVKLYYKELEPGFSSNGTFLDQGTLTVGASAQLQVTAKDSIGVLLDHQERTGSSGPLAGGLGTTDIESVQWNHREARWGVAAEYFNRGLSDETVSSQKSTSYLVARAWMQMTEKVKGWLEHQQTISGPANDQTNAGVSYQARKNIALDAQATYGSLGSSAQAGAAIDLSGTSVYLNERLTDGPAGQNTTTVLGARSPLGRASSVYTEYQWESTATGDRAVSLVGLQRQWEPVAGWKFVFSGESARVNAKAQDTNRSVVAAGVTYTGASGISLVSRSELRFDSGATRNRQILTSNQFDYKLREDLTFQARLRFSTTENRDTGSTEAKFEERGIGLAWRPVASNRFNALARYSHVLNQNPVPAGAPASPARSMDVFSVESIFAVTPRVEWLAKAAVQFQKEAIAGFETPDSKAYLTIQHFNFNLWKALDFGAEYRILAETATKSQRQGVLTELSWRLIKMLRLGVGYNFTDFSDNELSQNDYSVHGWFFRVQGRY